MKKSLILIMFLSACFFTHASTKKLPQPNADNLANYHLQVDYCAESCHQDEKVSEDLQYEITQCINCHGDFSGLEGMQHNQNHAEVAVCIDCHLAHETIKPKEICLDCHEEQPKLD